MQDNLGELDIAKLCESVWSAGGREAVSAMVQFSDFPKSIRYMQHRLDEIERVVMQWAEGRLDIHESYDKLAVAYGEKLRELEELQTEREQIVLAFPRKLRQIEEPVNE